MTERAIGATAPVEAGVYTALSIAAYLTLRPDLAGSLAPFALAAFLVFMLHAVRTTGEALDVWQGWIMLAVAVLLFGLRGLHWLLRRRRAESAQSRPS